MTMASPLFYFYVRFLLLKNFHQYQLHRLRITHSVLISLQHHNVSLLKPNDFSFCPYLLFFTHFLMSFCSKQLRQNFQNAISGIVFDYEHRKISICTLYLGNQFEMQLTRGENSISLKIKY